MSTAFENPVLEVVRLLDASAERVFAAWMNRDEWGAWIGPEGCKCDITLFEPRVGGQYRLLMNLSDGRTIPVIGEFKAIEAPNRFAFTWDSKLGDGASLVSVSLRDAGGGKTELTLRQESLPTREMREAHSRGWNSALNKLARHVKGETP
jgi:uncharacterized protein YndB with AHSA1/START domain